MNKEQKIWLSISIISGIILVTMMILAINDIRFRYGLHIIISTYCIMLISIVMYSFAEYISTREVVSILARKIREW